MISENDSNKLLSFSGLYDSILDRRIIQSLTNNNYLVPTKVQVEVIKKIIEGKDLLINSYTGSGKTLAYAIPICHSLLNMPKKSTGKIYSLVLVPSRELVIQTHEVFEQLLMFCENNVSVGTMFNADDNLLNKGKGLKLGSFRHNILISTPGDILNAKIVNSKESIFQNIIHLVIDEADLLFAFGYNKDMNKVLDLLPNSQDRKYQCILLSATLNKEVDSLKKMILHKPIFVDVKPEIKDDFDGENSNSKHLTSGLLSEYYTICNNMVDKWLMLYILLKMNVIPRKCLIFVSEVDTAYSIKVFLERFGMNCGVLTPIIPAATRRMLIQCFNQGSYDILVTSDTINEKDESILNVLKDNSITYRGVDYREVASVFNFDCPSSVRSYIHHIGRTARGGASGVSITIVNGNIPNEMEVLDELLSDKNRKINKLKITSEEVACFRYRIEDCMRILTKSNIQKHKLQEIQGLILNNTRLLKSGYFNKHPGDKNVLKSYHKHITNTLNISSSGREHIKNIPGYLYDMVNSNISNISDSVMDSSSSMPNILMDGVLSNSSNNNNGGSLTEKVQEAIRRMGGKDFQFVKENNLNPINTNKTGNSNKSKKRILTRKSQLKKEPTSYEGTVPDELPAISGRKLWKLRHKKRVKKYKDFIDDNKYKRKKVVRR